MKPKAFNLADNQPVICPTCNKIIPRIKRDDLEPIVAAQYCQCAATTNPSASTSAPMTTTEQEDKTV